MGAKCQQALPDLLEIFGATELSILGEVLPFGQETSAMTVVPSCSTKASPLEDMAYRNWGLKLRREGQFLVEPTGMPAALYGYEMVVDQPRTPSAHHRIRCLISRKKREKIVRHLSGLRSYPAATFLSIKRHAGNRKSWRSRLGRPSLIASLDCVHPEQQPKVPIHVPAPLG